MKKSPYINIVQEFIVLYWSYFDKEKFDWYSHEIAMGKSERVAYDKVKQRIAKKGV